MEEQLMVINKLKQELMENQTTWPITFINMFNPPYDSWVEKETAERADFKTIPPNNLPAQYKPGKAREVNQMFTFSYVQQAVLSHPGFYRSPHVYSDPNPFSKHRGGFGR